MFGVKPGGLEPLSARERAEGRTEKELEASSASPSAGTPSETRKMQSQ